MPPRTIKKKSSSKNKTPRTARSAGTTPRRNSSPSADRHQTEEALRRKSQLIDLSFEPILVWEVDGAIVEWNRGCSQLYGYSAAEAVGTANHVLLKTEFPLPLAMIEAQLQQNGIWSGELRHRTRDGREVVVESRWQLIIADKHRLVLEANRDITERKQAEAERQKFVSLADQSHEFIGMCDLDFKPFYVNEAGQKLVGLDSLEQACAVRVQDYFFPEDHAVIIGEFFPRVLRQGRSEVVVRFRHFKTGDALWMIYNVFQVRDENGRVAGYATVSRDITDLKQAEEALRRVHVELEHRVTERTAELGRSNERLQTEIAERRQAEDAVREKQHELQESRAQLQALTAKLITAQDSERQRIARDLHDDISQRLAAVVLDMAALERRPPVFPELIPTAITPVREEVERLANDLHNLAYQLHPSSLNHLGLQPAIEDYIHKSMERAGLQITLTVKDFPGSIPYECSTCLFRILQESLQNVVKHAKATEVAVKLSGSSKGISLSVIDNGKGFNEPDKSGHQKGLGLVSMQERLRLLNGFLNIHSRPADGTKVCAWIPFQEMSS